ncbi:MAG: Mce-associated rane protein [Kribbellaceae bacterium]|jgi:Mce-associated membrane protein|nr:Mce-associated rane protein [Kribbellaceae bacterium]
MSDTTRSGRGSTRRRIAGQRRPADRRTTDPTHEEDPTSTPAADSEEIAASAALGGGDAVSEDQPTTAATEESAVARLGAVWRIRPYRNVTQSDSDLPVAEQGQASGRLGKLLTVTIAVLLVLTLTVAVVLGIKAWQGQEAEQARSQATAAARKAAQLVLSYDYRTLDKDFSAARATLTPGFAADFDQTTKVVAEQAKKTKATVKAEVREVGVRDGDADRVTLLVFVNQTTTSTITQGKPRIDLNRARFTMVRNGDQWLVQEIAGL